MNTPPPAKIGKYDVLDILGRGGMGVVYRARDARLGRIVAIKRLTEGFRGNPDMLKRFYKEAERHASLHHNNIVTVFDAGEQDGEPYIVMEFIEGEALDKTLKARGRLQPEMALGIVEQVCLALAYAHRKGVVHRDVKPANVIVQRDGTAKLLDFGIAREEARLDQSLTSTGAMVGTIPYMAPERLRSGPIDGRSDIFSAGVVLYELLTGRLPFDAEYPTVIDQIMRLQPPPASSLVTGCPDGVDAILARALAKAAQERYTNADDMAMDAHEAAEGVTRSHVAELMSQAETHFNAKDFQASQDALRELLRLDKQHVAAKRLSSFIDQQLMQQQGERRAQELVRLAQQAAHDRDWERALAICEEALRLNPASVTLVALHKSVVEGRQTQERVSRLLEESANARRAGELTRAQAHAASAQQLDPHNSQVLALCRVLAQDIEEKRLKEELRVVMASATECLSARDFEEAFVLLERAASIAPESPDVLRARDELTTELFEEKRKGVVRRLEEKAAMTTTVEKLRFVSSELVEALKEFPNDPSLIRLRLNLEPRIQQLENELLVREVSRSCAELTPEEALPRVRAALKCLPGNEQLFGLEAALSERIARRTRERQLKQRLGEARQAIDDRLYLEAIKILERCQAEGLSSYEVEGLLEVAKSAASQRISQELLERSYNQAKQLIDDEDFETAAQVLRKALRQLDEPVLHRQLEEATEKQAAAQQKADRVLEQAEKLENMELFAEAVTLLEEQPAGVRRLTRVGEALGRARRLQEAETSFALLTGRCYAQLGTPEAVADLKRALDTITTADSPGSQDAMKEQLRRRCEEIYGEKASSAMVSARELLGQANNVDAEATLLETRPWLELAPSQTQEELRALEGEAAAAKKVMRFRRGSWQ